MSIATILRMFAHEAEATATRTGRADYRRAARVLQREADSAQRQADRSREKQARRRARMSPDAAGDMDSRDTARSSTGTPSSDGDTWHATRRTADSVTLRRAT